MITAVATLLVAVTGLVTAITQLSGDDETPAAVASDAAGTAEDPIDAELWSHIPAEVRSTCKRLTDEEDGSVPAYNCTYRRIVGLQYNLFLSGADLEAAYGAVKERYGVDGSGGSCERGNFEGEWVGERSMLCFVGDDGVAAIVLSDPETDILSFAWRNDGKLPELYDAWKTGLEPER